MNSQIQWRIKATRALPGLEAAKPAGEWADYGTKGKQETKNFLSEFAELGEGRSMFEYRVKPDGEMPQVHPQSNTVMSEHNQNE